MIERQSNIIETKLNIDRPLIEWNYLDNTFMYSENEKLKSLGLEFIILPHIPHIGYPSPLLCFFISHKTSQTWWRISPQPMFGCQEIKIENNQKEKKENLKLY